MQKLLPKFHPPLDFSPICDPNVTSCHSVLHNLATLHFTVLSVSIQIFPFVTLVTSEVQVPISASEVNLEKIIIFGHSIDLVTSKFYSYLRPHTSLLIVFDVSSSVSANLPEWHSVKWFGLEKVLGILSIFQSLQWQIRMCLTENWFEPMISSGHWFKPHWKEQKFLHFEFV